MAINFRKQTLTTGTEILLGKNASNNDELVKKFQGEGNIILHTAKPGSPFCVILKEKPTQKEIKESAIITASRSQDWRDNNSSVEIHQFTGRNVYKRGRMKTGTWGIDIKPKVIKVKKTEIEKLNKARIDP